MPTKLHRVSVTFPAEFMDLYEMMKRDAGFALRSESQQVVWILRQYYETARKNAQQFIPIPSTQIDRRAEAVFRTQDPLELSETRVAHDRPGPAKT